MQSDLLSSTVPPVFFLCIITELSAAAGTLRSTGGSTYTDAVIYDLENGRTLSYGKALTTHHQLTAGISSALDSLSEDALRRAQFLALSTTLATNACVEGIGGNAKLIFINVEAKTVAEMHEKYGLPAPRDIYFLDTSVTGWQDDLIDSLPSFRVYDSLAIDMCGTTTDIAIIKDYLPVTVKSGISIGRAIGRFTFS